MEPKLRLLFETAIKEKKVPAIGAFLVNNKGNFLFREAWGTNHLDEPQAAHFDADTRLEMYSCTKLITSIAVLQLMEQGKLSLSDTAEQYVPRIGKIQVLESFTDSDEQEPVLRPPKSAPTILQLLTHTTGFSYDFFDPLTLQYRAYTGRAPSAYYTTGEWEDFETPLIADPGTKYCYGISTDWLGFIIEAVTQISLAEYIDENVLKPLAMYNSSGFHTPQKARLLTHHDINGRVIAHYDTIDATNLPLLGGGAYLKSTMNDYAKLLSMILNKGTSLETGRQILKPATVHKYLFTDLLPTSIDRSLLGEIGNSVPFLSSPGCFLPSLPPLSRGWSCGLLLNNEDLPQGRNKGSGAWSGLGNLYYWIDPTANIAGMVCSSILPFFNPTVLSLFDQMERVAYGHEVAGAGEECTSNYRFGLPPPNESGE